MSVRLVVLGGGFTGLAVARVARAAGIEASATTRSEARADVLREAGIAPLLLSRESRGLAEVVTSLEGDTRLLVTFPPDGATDHVVAPLAIRAHAIAYVSSTGVYGDASGRVDEETPVDRRAPRASARLDAEQVWRDAGASIVRAPAIYGPGRGLHLRLARGEVRVAEDAVNSISRVHVDDLATSLFALLFRSAPSARGATYVAGDDAPAPHAEVVDWLCDALRIPPAPQVPLGSLDETLRHDRRVDSSRLRADLGLTLVFPTYREGFTQCLQADAALLDAALRSRGLRG